MDKRFSKGQSTRQNIVEVATRLFAEHGFEATSIEAILSACEISRGALYHHFVNKEDLFEAVLEAIEQHVTAASAAGSSRDGSPLDQLRAGCRSFLSAAQIDSFRRIALIDAPSVLGWQKWREIERRHGLGLLKTGLTAALGTRGHRPDEIDALAHLLLAALIEASLMIANASDQAATTSACTRSIDRLIDGIVG